MDRAKAHALLSWLFLLKILKAKRCDADWAIDKRCIQAVRLEDVDENSPYNGEQTGFRVVLDCRVTRAQKESMDEGGLLYDLVLSGKPCYDLVFNNTLTNGVFGRLLVRGLSAEATVESGNAIKQIVSRRFSVVNSMFCAKLGLSKTLLKELLTALHQIDKKQTIWVSSGDSDQLEALREQKESQLDFSRKNILSVQDILFVKKSEKASFLIVTQAANLMEPVVMRLLLKTANCILIGDLEDDHLERTRAPVIIDSEEMRDDFLDQSLFRRMWSERPDLCFDLEREN